MNSIENKVDNKKLILKIFFSMARFLAQLCGSFAA